MFSIRKQYPIYSKIKGLIMADGDPVPVPINGGLSHWVRPVITLMLSMTFCGLVVLKALGKISSDFEQSSISATFITLTTTAYALWFGEKSALKIPGK